MVVFIFCPLYLHKFTTAWRNIYGRGGARLMWVNEVCMEKNIGNHIIKQKVLSSKSIVFFSIELTIIFLSLDLDQVVLMLTCMMRIHFFERTQDSRIFCHNYESLHCANFVLFKFYFDCNCKT